MRSGYLRTMGGLVVTVAATLSFTAMPAAATPAVPAAATPAVPAAATPAVPAAPTPAAPRGLGFSALAEGSAAGSSTAPPRNDGLNEPIYWVHGIQRDKPHSFDCKNWAKAIGRYRALGATGAQHTIAYYKADKNCNTRIASAKDHKKPGIRELGRLLAWEIYNRYSKRNISVDAVGHSMGGLVIRAAITGVQKRTAGFPPRLYVEDVVTLSTPHTGAGFARFCKGSQCNDMEPKSAFMKWLNSSAQGSAGTDWTLIGTGDDDVVNWKSAVSTTKGAGWLAAGHKVVFISKQKLEHGTVYKATTGAYKSRYWNFYDGKWHNQTRGASPVVVARNASYYWRLW